MRTPILAGNWKMNKTSAEVQDFFRRFNARAADSWGAAQIMFAAPFTLLKQAREAAGDGVTILAQNVHFEKNGAFTGEISTEHLKDIGVTAALVGHSERRQYFGETDETVAKKVSHLLKQGMLAMACVGETQEQRQASQTEAVVSRQVQAIFDATPTVDHLVIAYEPVWAIGTGLTATDEQAQAVHHFIRDLARSHYDDQAADQLRILYGGSAKPGNIAGLISQTDIDGGLVGGASLQPDDFADMIDTITG